MKIESSFVTNRSCLLFPASKMHSDSMSAALDAEHAKGILLQMLTIKYLYCLNAF